MDTLTSDKSSDKLYKTRFYQKTYFVFILINVACFVQYVNMQYLASSMRGLEMDFGFSPKSLCILIVGETFAFLVTIPIWGVLCDLFEIKYILISTIFITALLLLLFGWLNNLYSMFLIRVLNGSMISTILPASQKFVVLSNMKNPGYAFGSFHFTGCFGRSLASILITKFSTDKYFNMSGWRVCSFVISFICVICSIILCLIPRLKPKNYRRSFYDLIDLDENHTLSNALKVIWKRFKGIMSCKTCKLLTLTTFFGQGPYTAAYFITMYFQYCKFSNLRAGITTGLIIIGGGVGGIIGGIATDKIHNRFPKYGRLCIGLGTGIVRLLGFSFVLFGLTFDNMLDLYPLLAISVFIIGMTFASISIVDRSILVDILLPSEQSFGMGAMLFLSGTTSSLIFPPILSFFVKNVFCYKEVDLDLRDLSDYFLRKNAFALRNGIAVLCIFSSIFSVIMYALMFPTYYKDAQAIKDKKEKRKTSKSKIFTDNPVKYPISRDGTIDSTI